MNTSQAIKTRWSARAFTDQVVDNDMIQQILDTARWAPSGSNLQPWIVAVVTGDTKKRLGQALADARSAGIEQEPDFHYYPDQWQAQYNARRKACGLALYKALEIGRQDKEKRMAVWLDNYHFFHAPAGLLFFMDSSMNPGALIDMGMFIQSVMLAATDHGLATCPQAALAEYPQIVRSVLKVPDTLNLICGLSLGFADMDSPVNNYRTERAQVDEFTTFYA